MTATRRDPLPRPPNIPRGPHAIEPAPLGPCRVTLTLPSLNVGRPFARYYGTVPEAPRPPANRFALRRLGITAEELDARVSREVDEALTEVCTELAMERLTANASPEAPRILTKEDLMAFFRATGIPPPGPLRGVYRWAMDLE